MRGEILDRDVVIRRTSRYRHRETYSTDDPSFSSKRDAREYYSDELHEAVSEDDIQEESGFWVRNTRVGYDLSWHGPFDTKEEALDYIDKVFDPVKTGIRMDDDLEGLSKKARPAWIRK